MFHVWSYVRSNIDGPGRKKEMDEFTLMEHYTLSKEQRDYLFSLVELDRKRPMSITQWAEKTNVLMMFDKTNDKTIVVKGDKK